MAENIACSFKANSNDACQKYPDFTSGGKVNKSGGWGPDWSQLCNNQPHVFCSFIVYVGEITHPIIRFGHDSRRAHFKAHLITVWYTSQPLWMAPKQNKPLCAVGLITSHLRALALCVLCIPVPLPQPQGHWRSRGTKSETLRKSCLNPDCRGRPMNLVTFTGAV